MIVDYQSMFFCYYIVNSYLRIFFNCLVYYNSTHKHMCIIFDSCSLTSLIGDLNNTKPKLEISLTHTRAVRAALELEFSSIFQAEQPKLARLGSARVKNWCSKIARKLLDFFNLLECLRACIFLDINILIIWLYHIFFV